MTDDRLHYAGYGIEPTDYDGGTTACDLRIVAAHDDGTPAAKFWNQDGRYVSLHRVTWRSRLVTCPACLKRISRKARVIEVYDPTQAVPAATLSRAKRNLEGVRGMFPDIRRTAQKWADRCGVRVHITTGYRGKTECILPQQQGAQS